MKFVICFLITFIASGANSQVITRQETKNKKEFPAKSDYATTYTLRGLDSFYDPNVDYSRFSGRLSDKDRTATVLKVQVESKNIKFFKASDPLKFWVAKTRHESKACVGNVRAIEKNFLTIYVKNLYPCWGEAYNFRRGTILVFESKRLAKRIQDSSRFRVTLLAKKRDFLVQLNKVNKFVWGFKQEQVDLAAKYDQQILELKRKKDLALNLLLAKKRDQVRIQRELAYRLDELESDINFYRVEKDELYTDRWHYDHDAGLPVYRRPQPLKDL